MKKVVVSGATGFIGGALVRALAERRDAVTVLSRRVAGVAAPPGGSVVQWEPEAAGDWHRALDGADAVVHLAGEQAVGARWTRAAKERIRASRVRSTEQLVLAMREAQTKPAVLVCASAVGYYGARSPDVELDEGAPAGTDFLASVCVEWERAARQASELGVRVVCARLGIVLGPGGGALAEMVKPFRAFAGGPIGSGEQVVSWVALQDAVAILLRLLDEESVSGPVNVVAPAAVDNETLSHAIGEALGRPSWLRVPALALRARFGEGAEPLLTGQRAVPGVLRRLGYQWVFPELEPALRAALAAG